MGMVFIFGLHDRYSSLHEVVKLHISSLVLSDRKLPSILSLMLEKIANLNVNVELENLSYITQHFLFSYSKFFEESFHPWKLHHEIKNLLKSSGNQVYHFFLFGALFFAQ